MDDFLYIAAATTREAMVAQSVTSNNLANVSTPGFRADLITAQSTYLNGQGQSSRVYGSLDRESVDLSPGVINTTGRELDVAVNGEGWMMVMAPDGSEGFTRRGDLRITDVGQLVNGAGQPLMGSSGPIALPPFEDVVIGTDGTVSIVPLGQAPNAVQNVDQIKLVDVGAADLVKGESGLLRLREGAEISDDGNVQLLTGSLESSNVSSVSALVDMIDWARRFEAGVKIMDTAEQLDQASAQLMRLN